MSERSSLMLVDASGYLYRAFHALPPLTTRDGHPTGALYGVANMLRRLLGEHDPACIAVVFDAPGRTFRDDLFAQYKANRPPMPDDMRRQVEPLLTLVKALGLPLLRIEGVEADDVIGTLAVRARDAGMDVTIVTGDKDMAQLVDERIHLLDTMKNIRYDAAGVTEKFGVPPERIIDYLALMGDTVDNIPGIPGVGPKTAAKWINEYGSLDGLVANAEQIKGKIGEKLRAGLAELPLSRQLATIHCDVDGLPECADLIAATPDVEALRELYRRFEFHTWLKQLESDPAHAPELADGAPPASGDATNGSDSAGSERRYTIIRDEQTLTAWIDRLRTAPLIAFDTETTSLEYMKAELVGLSFAIEPLEAAYVPLAHDAPGEAGQLDRDAVLAALKPLLEDPTRAKVGQHIKYDWHILAHYGVGLDGIVHDTMLESYVLDAGARHDMDTLAARVLGESTVTFETIAGKGAKQLTFNQIDVETGGHYAAEDADITLRLHLAQWPKLAAEAGLKSVYESIEIPLIPVLGRIEHRGVKVDADLLAAQSEEIAAKLAELEDKAHILAEKPFNLGSPKQLQEILYQELGLPVLKKTPKGQPSTAEEVLAELALHYPLPQVIMDHRALAKLKSTYTDKLPLMIHPVTARVHTSYHQAVASTGRLSSADPNLQNIPIRTAEGRRIRQAFIAEPGYRILAADYSQIELRIMAHLSEDEGLLKAFAEGADVHRATAAEVFGATPDTVTADQRRAAKAINFGLMYGMSPWGLARQLGIEQSDAKAYVERYFARYPGVRRFMDRTRAQAADLGYVETVYGRRLYLPDIKDRNPSRRAGAERTAINAPLQGTAADIIKRAMLAVDAWLLSSHIDARMIMQVHDELVFEVAEPAVDELRERLSQLMPAAATLRVPLEVDIGVGANWDEAH